MKLHLLWTVKPSETFRLLSLRCVPTTLLWSWHTGYPPSSTPIRSWFFMMGGLQNKEGTTSCWPWGDCTQTCGSNSSKPQSQRSLQMNNRRSHSRVAEADGADDG